MALAVSAAAKAGYPAFCPDAGLINRYDPGARLSSHQDKNERDFSNPIFSVSLGLPAPPSSAGRNAAIWWRSMHCITATFSCGVAHR
ncbi:alpha-ketoglutarate-dependent dioxygenase AlkB, partial [Rhodovulum sulfidophilum]